MSKYVYFIKKNRDGKRHFSNSGSLEDINNKIISYIAFNLSIKRKLEYERSNIIMFSSKIQNINYILLSERY